MQLTIQKPSFWKSYREVRDASNVVRARYRVSNMWYTQAEGEAAGRQLKFGFSGWDNRYTYMTDASGEKLATIEPVGWWGTEFKLNYKGKDFKWKMNGWMTAFSFFDGETEIMRVHPGGYFTPGTVELSRPMDDTDSLALILYGLYQAHQVAAQAAAAGGGGEA